MPLILSGTTGISGVDGSAGTPAAQGSDTNTGLFFPAADTVSLATAGSERLRVFSSGGMSLGNTTDPGATNLSVSGTVADGTAVIRPLVNGGSWTYSSGTPSTIDLTTTMPSWVKRITIMLNGLSFAAGGISVVRVGSGSLVTSGYTSNSMSFATTPTITSSSQTGGMGNIGTSAAATTVNGTLILTSDGANTWTYSQQIFRTTDNVSVLASAFITLSGSLTHLSLVATTSTFDAGTVYWTYE
jgi:hypothetical protein